MAESIILPADRTRLGPRECESRIRPAAAWPRLDIASLWHARELLYFLVWRDIKVRYKQTLLGAAWALVQPLATMIIFVFVFGNLVRIESDGIPYPLFSFAALLPWTFVANGVSHAANSLVSSVNLITKVKFPRLAVPIAGVLTGLVDFLLAFVILVAMLAWYGYRPGFRLLLLPVPLGIGLITALGVGFWLSALNVKFRDVRHSLPFLMQLWMYCSPIVYPASLFSERGRVLYGLNPIAGVIEGFRWALFGTEVQVGAMLCVSAIASVSLFLTGAMYFRRMEQTFADVV